MARGADLALQAYRAARRQYDQAVAAGQPECVLDALLDMAIDAAAAYVEMPAEVPQDLADKIEVIIADGDWERDAAALLADARRLAA